MADDEQMRGGKAGRPWWKKKRWWIFLGAAGYLASILIQSTPVFDGDYHPRLGATVLDDQTLSALARFPDVNACLLGSGTAQGAADLNAINWNLIRNDGDAKVCLFMIFEGLNGPEEVMLWLENQGFRTWGPIDQGRIRESELRQFDFDVTDDFVKNYRNLAVGGSWDLTLVNGARYPTWSLMKYVRIVASRSQTISATWFPDGRLRSIKITYDSTLN